MKGSKQSSIASFFTAKATPAGSGGSQQTAAGTPGKPRAGAKTKLEDQTNLPQPAAPPAQTAPAAEGSPEVPVTKRKRLKRSVEDSPDRDQAPAAEATLEDDLGNSKPKVSPPASPKRTRSTSPRKIKQTSAAAPEATAPLISAEALPTLQQPVAATTTGSTPATNGKSSSTPAKATANKTAAAGTTRKSSGTAAAVGGLSKGSKGPGAASKAAVAVAAPAEEEDEISNFTSSDDSSGISGGDGADGVGGEVQSGVKRLKRSDDTSAPKKKRAKKAAGKTSAVEGVGSGALDAAQRAMESDIPALCTWGAGQPVPYSFLSDTFEAIAETTKRLVITSTLTNCFRAILATNPKDLLPAVYMCVNRVAPAHHGIELGIGDSILLKALATSSGRQEAALKKEYESVGDLGTLAVNARGTQKTIFAAKPLTIAGVFQTFKDIANCSGTSSQEKKKGMVVKLLAASKGNEAGYVMRSLQAKLRIGLAEQSVLVALAHAMLLHLEGVNKGKDSALADKLELAAQAVKAAYSECPSYDVLIPAMLEHGLWELPKHCHFMPSVPVKPMLAKPTNGVSEVFDKFAGKEFTCEYKYDGERAQIHIMDGGKNVMIFSRNSENLTVKYPDIVSRVPGLLAPGVTSAVLDGEAVAWDAAENKILPFQVLSTRKRKDVAVADIKVQVVVYVFDCLYLNGKSLLQESLIERRKAMHSAVKEKEGELYYAITKTSNDIEELQLFLNEAVDGSTEGLIVKTLDDTYEPAKRSSHWLKLKKDYLDGVGDTFDVVPVGAFYGRGKRTGVFGAYLLAVYDPDTETYQTISKLGTGFSEEQLKDLSESLKPHIIPGPRKYYKWGETQEPDVWFDTKQVWEVKAADLSVSPVHKAAIGLVDPDKGISIRFPRLIRVRDDKGPEDSTSAQQVAEMYQKQAVISKNKKPADDDDE